MDPLTGWYRAHGPLIRAYLARMVSWQDVDDVLQVVFTEAWRARDRYDSTRSPEAWLLGIARKRAIDHLRARRPATIPLEVIGDPADRDGRDPGETLADRDRVRQALSALPAVQREALTLAYYGELSQREIAEYLDVPLGTVKARTARGLHRLSSLLAAA
ncbi:RNA polymerase sigma factor [Thermoactinospora rubra]|uniref:RNA polymerase sigma factor n=1 Tax=Thermoactinospora rubra TaxID=1088767 RepID=UPI000A11C96B|nr:sigma-70 family RNA polymerase sigma factor [Thermoactinospora rubra]